MRIVLVGPPGAGKGTQAQFISSHLAIPRISTGDIFRYNVTSNTELGRQAREYMERGDLVPDEVTVAMVRDRLGEDDAQEGFLLDGFPRNVPQAETLKKMLSEWDARLSVVLELVIDERPSGYRATLEYSADLFDPSTIRRVADHYRAVLTAVLAAGAGDSGDAAAYTSDAAALKTAINANLYDSATGLLASLSEWAHVSLAAKPAVAQVLL